MLVTILPFFLVANVVVDDPGQQSEWTRYGPECTYDVLLDVSIANIAHEDDNACALVATELKCRPKGHDSLSCHFGNSRVRQADPEKGKCTKVVDFMSAERKFLDEKPFEVRFNSHGIENLVVDKLIPRRMLPMIKDIVSQLNIGFEVQEKRNRFTVTEKSVVGRCEVDVKIIRGDADSADDGDDDSSGEDANFLIGFASSDGESAQPIERNFRVEKMRNPKKCTRPTYFFGNFGEFNFDNRDFYMNMTDSVSHIKISKDEFVTRTISEGKMMVTNNSRIMRPRQNLRLKLKRIDCARSPLPEIQDPAATSVFAFSNLATIPEDIEHIINPSS